MLVPNMIGFRGPTMPSELGFSPAFGSVFHLVGFFLWLHIMALTAPGS